MRTFRVKIFLTIELDRGGVEWRQRHGARDFFSGDQIVSALTVQRNPGGAVRVIEEE